MLDWIGKLSSCESKSFGRQIKFIVYIFMLSTNNIISISSGDWRFGYVVCQFWLAVDYTASTASIFNLFILSLDRYWSITSPLRYLRRRTKKRALLMIALAWTGASMWVIPVLGWHHMMYRGERQTPGQCVVERD
jgi:histamine receptor H1